MLDPSEQIHDEIDVWHAGGTGLSLHEFLGMTWPEYQLWAEKHWTLSPILAAKKTGLSLPDMVKLSEGGTSLAARGIHADEFRKVEAWLRQTKRIQ